MKSTNQAQNSHLQMSHSQINQLVKLALFFNNQEFNSQLKNPKFCEFLLNQKNDLLQSLLLEFQITESILTINSDTTFKQNQVSMYPQNNSQNNSQQNFQNITPLSEEETNLNLSQTKVSAVESFSSSTQTDYETISALIKSICSEKTGYPVEFLEDDMDLESDLGIDTLKQMEIVAQTRESLGLTKQSSFALKDVPTLRKLTEYSIERLKNMELSL